MNGTLISELAPSGMRPTQNLDSEAGPALRARFASDFCSYVGHHEVSRNFTGTAKRMYLPTFWRK